jgi:hypothetical protein
VKAPGKGIRIAASLMAAVLGRLPAAEPVDLTRPFEADRDTICLFHLDDYPASSMKPDARECGHPSLERAPELPEGTC